MDILEQIAASIGNTPLADVSNLVGSGCRAFAKCEFKNPTGSHYDRAYLALFRDLESRGQIVRGKTHLIEASSGSAGASFAWFCKQLGYDATVVLPGSLPPGFYDHIRRQNSNVDIVTSDHGDYIKGAVRTLREIMVKNRRWVCPDHSRNAVTLQGMAQIATESVDQLQKVGVNSLDFFVAACGNGATVVGPGPVLKQAWPALKTVLFETANAPSGFRRLHPEYPQKGGAYHSLFGTGGWDILLPFVTDPQYGFQDFADDDFLITEQDLHSAIAAAPLLPFSVGNSSLAALWVARKVAEKHPGTTIFTIFYDVGSKYGR
jgi:cysteine synthase A